MSIRASMNTFEFYLAWSFTSEHWTCSDANRQLAQRVLVCGQPVMEAYRVVQSWHGAPKDSEEAHWLCADVYAALYGGTLLFELPVKD